MITASSLHPQRGRRVDPVAVEARVAQPRKHRVRPVAALAGDDRVETTKRRRARSRPAACPEARPIAGTLPPALDVEKNTGSIVSKSRSSSMRCISTDPTIPRQPTNPTRIAIPLTVLRLLSPLRSRSRVTPRSAGDDRVRPSRAVPIDRARRAAAAGDVRRAQALSQRGANGCLDAIGDIGASRTCGGTSSRATGSSPADSPCPGPRCPAPSRGSARTAPCRSHRATPTAACRSSRRASTPRRTGCRRTGCR